MLSLTNTWPNYCFLTVAAVATGLILLWQILLGLVLLRQRRRWRRLARELFDKRKAFYSGPLEYDQVLPRDFPQLDQTWYDEVTSKLTHAAFRHVGDFENLTATRQFPHILRNLHRFFISDDEVTMACACHIKVTDQSRDLALKGDIPTDRRLIDFETEFSDGTFLVTNNATARIMRMCPGIMQFQHPPDTPLEQLLNYHREQLKLILAGQGSEPIRIRSSDELLASQNRQHKVKSDYMRSCGCFSREELEAIAGRGQELGKEIEALQSKERLEQKGR